MVERAQEKCILNIKYFVHPYRSGNANSPLRAEASCYSAFWCVATPTKGERVRNRPGPTRRESCLVGGRGIVLAACTAKLLRCYGYRFLLTSGSRFGRGGQLGGLIAAAFDRKFRGRSADDGSATNDACSSCGSGYTGLSITSDGENGGWVADGKHCAGGHAAGRQPRSSGSRRSTLTPSASQRLITVAGCCRSCHHAATFFTLRST